MYRLSKMEEEMLKEALNRINAKHTKSPFIKVDDEECEISKYEVVNSLKGIVRKVYFSKPKTIVIWKDGTKTIVTAQKERFDEEKGILMAFYKRLFGKSYMNALSDVIANAEAIKPKEKKGKKK